MAAATLTLYEVEYLCGGQAGARQIWAPDGATASRTLRDRASLWGLPYETVLVTHVHALTIKEASVAR